GGGGATSSSSSDSTGAAIFTMAAPRKGLLRPRALCARCAEERAAAAATVAGGLKGRVVAVCAGLGWALPVLPVSLLGLLARAARVVRWCGPPLLEVARIRAPTIAHSLKLIQLVAHFVRRGVERPSHRDRVAASHEAYARARRCVQGGG